MPIIDCWCDFQLSVEGESWLRHNAPGVHTVVPGSPHDPIEPAPVLPNSGDTHGEPLKAWRHLCKEEA